MNIRKIAATVTLFSFSITSSIPADYNVNHSSRKALHPRSSFSKDEGGKFFAALRHEYEAEIDRRGRSGKAGVSLTRRSSLALALSGFGALILEACGLRRTVWKGVYIHLTDPHFPPIEGEDYPRDNSKVELYWQIVDQVGQYIKLLPPKHQAAIKKIVLHDQKTLPHKDHPGGVPGYCTVDGIIHLAAAEMPAQGTVFHEAGHAVWYRAVDGKEKEDFKVLNIASGDDPANFVNPRLEKVPYAMRGGVVEDWAETYREWTRNSLWAINSANGNYFLSEKLLSVANQFIFKHGGKIYLRAYKNFMPLDIELGVNQFEINDAFTLWTIVWSADRELDKGAKGNKNIPDFPRTSTIGGPHADFIEKGDAILGGIIPLAGGDSEKFAASFNAWVDREPTLLKRLASFAMKSEVAKESPAQFLSFAMALGFDTAEKLLWELMAGTSEYGTLSQVRSLSTVLLEGLARENGISPVDILTSQGNRITQFGPRYSNWVEWVEKGAYKGELKELLDRLRGSPVTGAVALKKDPTGVKEIASGWIAGDRIEVQGLSERESQTFVRHLGTQMEKFPGFDFSGVRIRVVEGAGRLMELEGETITVDHRVFQNEWLLQIELCHEVLEYIASRTPLGFAEPSVRETVVLIFELEEFSKLQIVQKISILKTLMQNPGLDLGRFSTLLYQSLEEGERSTVIQSLSAAGIELPKEPFLVGVQAQIFGIAAFLDNAVYSQVIRRGVQERPAIFIAEVQKAVSTFVKKIEKMKEITLKVALKKWTHERFPGATDADIWKRVQIRDDLLKLDEEQNRTAFWRVAVPEGIGGSVIAILLTYAERFNVEGSMMYTGLFLALALLVAPVLIFIILFEFWKQWKRWSVSAAQYDTEAGVIRVNPLRSKRQIERAFKKVLEDLASSLDPAEKERLSFMPPPTSQRRTSAFKSSRLGTERTGFVGWGGFLWQKFRYLGRKSPVLIKTIQYFMDRLGPALDIKTLKIRILRSSDQLAYIDLAKRTIYVDERILDHRGLLHLEFAEELAHLFLSGDDKKENPGLEELATLMIKVEYFRRLDPVDQAEILLDLANHPDWDRGRFGKILAGVLSPKRRLAVQNVAKLYHHATIPPQMFASIVEKEKLMAMLITYILSSDADGKPLYGSDVVESLKGARIDEIGEMTSQRLIERFEDSPSLLLPRPTSGTRFREEILLDLHPEMDESEREDVLVRALISTVTESEEDLPMIKDWIEAYLDFIYPVMERSSELDMAISDLRQRLRNLDPREDISSHWKKWGYEVRKRYHLSLSDQAEVEEIINLSFILQVVFAKVRNRFPEVADVMTGKVILFLKQKMLKLRSRGKELTPDGKWLVDAFISVIVATPSTRLYQVFLQVGERVTLLIHLSRFFLSKGIEVAQHLSELVLAIPLQKSPLVGKKMVWAEGFSPERDGRWLMPILTDADFIKTLGIDWASVEVIRIQSLAGVLNDVSSSLNENQKFNPFFLILESPNGAKEGVLIKVEEPVFVKRAVDEGKVDAVTGKLFWKMKAFQFYDIDSFGKRFDLSKRDKSKWQTFIAERMGDHVALLTAQLMDAQYYSGRLKVYGREAFEWFGKRSLKANLYEQMLTLGPEQYEQAKSEILDQLRGRESQKFEASLNDGMTVQQLKMAVTEHLGSILILFPLEATTSFAEMKGHTVLAPVWWAWKEYLFRTAGDGIRKGHFDWGKHFFTGFQSYLQWVWPLDPERALEVFEGLLNRVEEGMTVKPIAQFPDDGLIEGGEASPNLGLGRAFTSVPRMMLLDREGKVRSEVFLLHLGRIPEDILLQMAPHLSDGAVRSMGLAAGLLKELGYESESQRLAAVGVDHPTLQLWRSFVSLYQFAIGVGPLPRRNFQDVLPRLIRRLQLETDEISVDGLLAEFIIFDAIESLISLKGYRLGRILYRFKGTQFYEAQSEDGENLLVQVNVREDASHLRRASIFQPPLVESQTMNLKVSPHQTRRASFRIWRWSSMTEFREKVLHPIGELSEVLDLLKVIQGLSQLLEENPKGYKHEGVVPLWITDESRVVIHPIVLEGKGEKRLNWREELALPLRALLENISMHLSEIIEAELSIQDLEALRQAVKRLVEQNLSQLTMLLKEETLSPEAIAILVKPFILLLEEVQGYIDRAHEARLLRIETLETRSRFFEQAA